MISIAAQVRLAMGSTGHERGREKLGRVLLWLRRKAFPYLDRGKGFGKKLWSAPICAFVVYLLCPEGGNTVLRGERGSP